MEGDSRYLFAVVEGASTLVKESEEAACKAAHAAAKANPERQYLVVKLICKYSVPKEPVRSAY